MSQYSPRVQSFLNRIGSWAASCNELPGRTLVLMKSSRGLVGRILLHLVFLVVAVACFALYEHFKVVGRSDLALGYLVAAAIFALLPLRDLLHVVFGVSGAALHMVHAVGSLILIAVPLSGFVSGTPLLTNAAMAPFAVMGAAQALMHAEHPRNAKQAQAMRSFASSLPELRGVADGKQLATPAGARRAIVILSDIITKAQTLGQTELQSDPRYRSALGQASAGFGAKLGLDAVEVVLGKLAANPATAFYVPKLRQQLASARRTIAATSTR
jgi:hypothetical protein